MINFQEVINKMNKKNFTSESEENFTDWLIQLQL